MKTRRLGRTNFDVSVLGVGGHIYPVGEGTHDFCTHDERAQLIAHLVENGVNYFDTTWLNEVELLADSFQRASINPASQSLRVSLQYVDGISDSNWRTRLRSELERRLEIMGFDKAPLFIMGVGNGRPGHSEIAAACEAMHALKAEGLIGNIGVSCHDFAAFDSIASIIDTENNLDYMMIRYNWKFQLANDHLFQVARAHDVGIVLMKVLCWDCGYEDWGRRISVFEPTDESGRAPHPVELNAAQRSLLWGVQSSPCATTAISINAQWEADQLLDAIPYINDEYMVETADFPIYANRLHDRLSLQELSTHAESAAIRQRATALLR